MRPVLVACRESCMRYLIRSQSAINIQPVVRVHHNLAIHLHVIVCYVLTSPLASYLHQHVFVSSFLTFKYLIMFISAVLRTGKRQHYSTDKSHFNTKMFSVMVRVCINYC